MMTVATGWQRQSSSLSVYSVVGSFMFACRNHPARKMMMATKPPVRALSERGVRLAQKMQVGPCIPVGIQL